LLFRVVADLNMSILPEIGLEFGLISEGPLAKPAKPELLHPTLCGLL
jgi:hypothetical protein